MLSVSARPRAWAFSVDNEVSIKVFKWVGVGEVPLRVSAGGRGELFGGSQTWAGGGKGPEGTDTGQMWVGWRAQSSRSPRPMEVLGAGVRCGGACIQGWLQQDTDFQGPGHLMETAPRGAGGQPCRFGHHPFADDSMSLELDDISRRERRTVLSPSPLHRPPPFQLHSSLNWGGGGRDPNFLQTGNRQRGPRSRWKKKLAS